MGSNRSWARLRCVLAIGIALALSSAGSDVVVVFYAKAAGLDASEWAAVFARRQLAVCIGTLALPRLVATLGNTVVGAACLCVVGAGTSCMCWFSPRSLVFNTAVMLTGACLSGVYVTANVCTQLVDVADGEGAESEVDIDAGTKNARVYGSGAGSAANSSTSGAVAWATTAQGANTAYRCCGMVAAIAASLTCTHAIDAYGSAKVRGANQNVDGRVLSIYRILGGVIGATDVLIAALAFHRFPLPDGNGKGPREGASCRGHDHVERRIKAMGHGQCDKHSPLRGSGASSASAFGMVLANSSFVTLWLTLTLNSVLQKTFNQRWLWYVTDELGGSPRLYGAVDSISSLLGLLSIVVQGQALRSHSAKHVLLLVYSTVGVCYVGLAFARGWLMACVCFGMARVLLNGTSVATSMWVSGTVGARPERKATAFACQKISVSLLNAVWLHGLAHTGMVQKPRTLFSLCAMLFIASVWLLSWVPGSRCMQEAKPKNKGKTD